MGKKKSRTSEYPLWVWLWKYMGTCGQRPEWKTKIIVVTGNTVDRWHVSYKTSSVVLSCFKFKMKIQNKNNQSNGC